MKIDVTVPTLDLSIYQGDTFVQALAFLADGIPVDLSGWTFTGQVRKHAAATDIDATFAIDVSQASVGKVTMSLTAVQTGTLGSGVWDLQSTMELTVQTRIRGGLFVTGDVTR